MVYNKNNITINIPFYINIITILQLKYNLAFFSLLLSSSRIYGKNILHKFNDGCERQFSLLIYIKALSNSFLLTQVPFQIMETKVMIP